MINALVSTKAKSKKRVGRGMGSGKGSHTVGRGQKGQKTRRKIHPLFEGTKNKKALIQRLPLLRGKGKLKSLAQNPIIVDVAKLNSLPAGTVVNLEVLIKNGLVSREAARVGAKILGKTKVEKKLTINTGLSAINLPVSKGARQAIEARGGSTY